MNLTQHVRVFLRFSIMGFVGLLLLIGGSIVAPTLAMSGPPPTSESGWHLQDSITPTLDTVTWREEGVHEPSNQITDGRWYERHCDHFLVHSDYTISAFFFERFNWTAVNATFSHDVVGPRFPSFTSFYNQIRANPAWWLEYNWQLNVDGLGIADNTTLVTMEYDNATAEAHVRMILQITNVPGYFLGYLQSYTPLLSGIDLSEIYLGQLSELRWTVSETPEQTLYKLHFEVGAHLMEQQGALYTFHLRFHPQLVNRPCSINRSFRILMPITTEIYNATPTNRGFHRENVAYVELQPNDLCPDAIVIWSGPPIKDLTEIVTENVERWLTEPEIWLAVGTIIFLAYGTWTGRQMWDRRKTYYRLYRSMVRVFDSYADDPATFQQELASISKSITEYFIDGKITDDQFDTLLTRRDDLVNRVTASTR